MAEDLIQPERIKAIQESICGFLLDEVINPNGEFYADPKISVGRVDPNKDIMMMRWLTLRILYTFVEQNLYAWRLRVCNYNKYILLYARYEYIYKYTDVQEYDYADIHGYKYTNVYKYKLVETQKMIKQKRKKNI